MERIDETDIISIHSDLRTIISKHLRDRFSMKPGDKLTIHIQGITRKINAPVEPLVAARVEAALKPEEKPKKLYEEEAGKVEPIQTEKPTVTLTADQAEKLLAIKEG